LPQRAPQVLQAGGVLARAVRLSAPLRTTLPVVLAVARQALALLRAPAARPDEVALRVAQPAPWDVLHFHREAVVAAPRDAVASQARAASAGAVCPETERLPVLARLRRVGAAERQDAPASLERRERSPWEALPALTAGEASDAGASVQPPVVALRAWRELPEDAVALRPVAEPWDAAAPVARQAPQAAAARARRQSAE